MQLALLLCMYSQGHLPQAGLPAMALCTLATSMLVTSTMPLGTERNLAAFKRQPDSMLRTYMVKNGNCIDTVNYMKGR